MTPPISIAPTIAPMTMPAIAPPESTDGEGIAEVVGRKPADVEFKLADVELTAVGLAVMLVVEGVDNVLVVGVEAVMLK